MQAPTPADAFLKLLEPEDESWERKDSRAVADERLTINARKRRNRLMKLLVRGSAGLSAMLFASYLTFSTKPLLAEIKPSSERATQQQQEQQEPTKAAQPEKKEAEHKTIAPTASAETSTETVEPSSTVVAASSNAKAEPTENLLASAPQVYNATSYSRPGRGASGMGVRQGTIAAGPRILPFGTRVRIDAGEYSGEYTVTDAGTAIRGRKIDIFLPSYSAACRFGRRNVKLTVLSYGGKKTRKK
jgi:3D (Asp-Asp-Asp) domain-containing protein